MPGTEGFTSSVAPDARRFAATGFILAMAVVFSVGVAVLDGNEWAVHAWSDFWWTLASFTSGILCLRAARRVSEPSYRAAWRCLSAGAFAWFGGMLVWSWSELVLLEYEPFPALADAGFLAFPVLFTAGILFYRSRSPARKISLLGIADLGVVICADLLTVTFVFGEIIRTWDGSLVALLTALGYPVLHLSALLFGLISLWQHTWEENRLVLLLLIVGIAVNSVASVIYGHVVLTGEYTVGWNLDVMWLLSFAILGWAAIEQGHVTARAGQDAAGLPAASQPLAAESLVPAFALAWMSIVALMFREEMSRQPLYVTLPLALVLAGFFGLRHWASHKVQADLIRQVRDSQQRLLAIVNNTASIIFIKDLHGRYQLVNHGFLELTGMSEAEVTGRTDAELFPASAAAFAENNRMAIERGVPLSFEDRFRDTTGQERIFLTVLFPLKELDGKTYALCGISTDITSRKQADDQQRETERELAEVRRMESLGMLAAGVAHDFNNILATILGNTDLLGLSDALTIEDRQITGNIRAAARQAADMVRQLLSYAGRSPLTTAPVDINRLVGETVRAVSGRIAAGAELALDLDPALPLVQADPVQLGQVIMNLVVNASDALEGREGTIRISTRPAAAAEIPAAMEGRSCILLSVSDTGHGIAPETQQRLFEPFFTTKKSGHGLGLPAVLGIVNRHGGIISVQSAPGRGTTFQVLLPVGGPRRSAPGQARSAAGSASPPLMN